MTRIKICGITRLEDAIKAIELGVNALGFVLAQSPRKMTPDAVAEIISEIPPFVNKVGVFVNINRKNATELAKEIGLDTIQLHGDDLKEYDLSNLPTIHVYRVKDEKILESISKDRLKYFLLDTYQENKTGGTGQSFDWSIARQAGQYGKVILSGGLNEQNIVKALDIARPYGVDVSSGVESSPGIKDHNKMEKFISEVKNWDNRIN
ncbi:MAG: phosphoribosylanthranilate isomerase [Candidatus Zixiibacteriota bacterium]